MPLEMQPGVRVRKMSGFLPFPPSYSLNGLSVKASPHYDQETHEKLLHETFGSTDWLWEAGDEFRFSTTNNTLCGLTLKIPEDEVEYSRGMPSWLDTPITEGLLVCDEAKDFTFTPAEARWVSNNGSHLICTYTQQPVSAQGATRLRVSQDLDLFFASNRLAGWILESPILHVVDTPEIDPGDERLRELGSEYHEYSEIMKEPTLSSIQDGDRSSIEKFASLLEDLKERPQDPRRDAMIAKLTEFYNDWVAT